MFQTLGETTLNIYLELKKFLMLHSLINDSVFCKEKQKQKILAYFLLHY